MGALTPLFVPSPYIPVSSRGAISLASHEYSSLLVVLPPQSRLVAIILSGLCHVGEPRTSGTSGSSF